MKTDKIKVMVCLPNGEQYQYKLPPELVEFKDEGELITNFRKLFAGSGNVEFPVEPDSRSGIQKKRTLILWGEVLKNTFIKVNHY